MDKLLIFLICFYFSSAKIKINDLRVPQSIESGTVDDVILDCDFDTGGEPGIEVKWFYNGIYEQIYQWIPETNKPGYASGRLKDNIDTNYTISNDKNTMYRALHITGLNPELSGNYTCKVSGDKTEASATKSMIIYDPADEELDLSVVESDSVVLCNAGGLYPEPNMTLYVINLNDSQIVLQEDDELIEFDSDGFYNISSTLYFDVLNLTGDFQYICELSIPGTDYKLQKDIVHHIEDQAYEDILDSAILIQIGVIYIDPIENSTDVNSTESSWLDYNDEGNEDSKKGNDTHIYANELNQTLNEDFVTEEKETAGNSMTYHPSLFFVFSTALLLVVTHILQS